MLADWGFICSSQSFQFCYNKLFLLNKAQIQPNLWLNQRERALRRSCSHLFFTLAVEATCIIRWWACVLDIAPSGPIHRAYEIHVKVPCWKHCFLVQTGAIYIFNLVGPKVQAQSIRKEYQIVRNYHTSSFKLQTRMAVRHVGRASSDKNNAQSFIKRPFSSGSVCMYF